MVKGAGIELTSHEADVGLVVGGDGIFTLYGRLEAEPLLFVGVRSNKPTGSKAYMAQVDIEELPAALGRLKKGEYTVREHGRLEAFKNGGSLGEVFTDIYLQRGEESNGIRYRVRATTPAGVIEESAIGDGVIVTTAAGSTGYYSYPDRIRGDTVVPGASSRILDGEVGVCHIIPTYGERAGSDVFPLRYTLPWGSTVELWITRPADARVYGSGTGRKGVKVNTKDRISVKAGKNSTRLVEL